MTIVYYKRPGRARHGSAKCERAQPAVTQAFPFATMASVVVYAIPTVGFFHEPCLLGNSILRSAVRSSPSMAFLVRAFHFICDFCVRTWRFGIPSPTNWWSLAHWWQHTNGGPISSRGVISARCSFQVRRLGNCSVQLARIPYRYSFDGDYLMRTLESARAPRDGSITYRLPRLE